MVFQIWKFNGEWSKFMTIDAEHAHIGRNEAVSRMAKYFSHFPGESFKLYEINGDFDRKMIGYLGDLDAQTK